VRVRTFKSKEAFDRWRRYLFGVVYKSPSARKRRHRPRTEPRIHIKNIDTARGIDVDLSDYREKGLKKKIEDAKKKERTILIPVSGKEKSAEVPYSEYVKARVEAIENVAKMISDEAVREDIYESDFLGMHPLTLWERDFLSSLHRRGLTWYELSDKQKAVLRRIAEKYIGPAEYVNGKVLFTFAEEKGLAYARRKEKYIKPYTPKEKHRRTLRDVISRELIREYGNTKTTWLSDNLVSVKYSFKEKEGEEYYHNIFWLTDKRLNREDFIKLIRDGGIWDNDKKRYKALVYADKENKFGKSLFDIRIRGYNEDDVERLAKKRLDIIKRYEVIE